MGDGAGGAGDLGWLLEAFAALRPRGRFGPGDCLLDLAAGRREGSISAYARAWRCSWETAQRILETHRELTESKCAALPRISTDSSKPTQGGLPGVEQRKSPILRLLPSVDRDGEPVHSDEKAAWWEHEGEAVTADARIEAVKAGVQLDDQSGTGAFLRSTAIRYFKRYLAGERRFRGLKESKALENAAEAYFSTPLAPSDLQGDERPSARLRHREM